MKLFNILFKRTFSTFEFIFFSFFLFSFCCYFHSFHSIFFSPFVRWFVCLFVLKTAVVGAFYSFGAEAFSENNKQTKNVNGLSSVPLPQRPLLLCLSMAWYTKWLQWRHKCDKNTCSTYRNTLAYSHTRTRNQCEQFEQISVNFLPHK